VLRESESAEGQGAGRSVPCAPSVVLAPVEERARAEGKSAGPMTHTETNPPTQQPQPSQTVLVLADPSKRAYGHKTHAPDCRWVKGVKLAYMAVPASSVSPTMGRCSHCGGGR
jgi:hypothetical protein